jgi:acetoin utilization protein AcuB
MLVREFMTADVATVTPAIPASVALDLMAHRQIRRLPVIEGRTLRGIVTQADLQRVAPDVAVGAMMHANPVTITPEETIEEAAVRMRQHKIGALPVLYQDALVGIITESDVFEALIRVMGLRSGGTRLTIRQDDGAILERIATTVRENNAEILSLSAYQLHGANWIVVRVDAPYPLHLIQTLVERGVNVTHLAPLAESQAADDP